MKLPLLTLLLILEMLGSGVCHPQGQSFGNYILATRGVGLYACFSHVDALQETSEAENLYFESSSYRKQRNYVAPDSPITQSSVYLRRLGDDL